MTKVYKWIEGFFEKGEIKVYHSGERTIKNNIGASLWIKALISLFKKEEK